MNTDSSTDVTGRDRWLALWVFCGGFLILAPGAFWGLPSCKIAVGAQSVLHGDVPYRDFWTMYAPGQFYAMAGLFSVFGTELIVQGIARSAVVACMAGIFFILVRRVGGNRVMALALSAVVVAMFWTTSPELSSHPLALLPLLLALDRVLRFYQGEKAGVLFQAGLLMGLAACFKHDVAGYVAIASTISFFLVWLSSRSESDERLSPLAASIRLAAGTLVVFLPVSLYFAWAAGADVWQDLVVFPATDFRGVRGEAYPRWIPRWDQGLVTWLQDPSLTSTIVFSNNISVWSQSYIPIYVFAAGVIVVLTQGRHMSAFHRAAAILLLCHIPFFWSAAHVQRNTHLHSMAIFSMLLGAMAWQSLSTLGGTRGGVGRAAWLLIAILYIFALCIPPAHKAGSALKNLRDCQAFDMPGTRGIIVPRHEYEVFHPICSFVRQHVPEDERIFCGVTRHDAIVINDPRFHFLTGRRSGCRYHELHPGITDRVQTQDEIIQDLEQHKVRLAILWDIGFPEKVLNQKKALRMAKVAGIGAEKLDEYMDAEFEPIGKYGEYVLMWRKGSARPEE